ncbi:MAG: LEA type 2 family protein [Deltaproteobacteria bacterium]|nr:LEA type 2 family protein [Deltaproteobacteria bacterium]
MRTLRPTLLLALSTLLGCGFFRKPTLPRLTVRGVDIVEATSAGLHLRTHMVVRNTNAVGLTARSIKLRVTVAARDLGETELPNATRLPSEVDVPIDADVTAAWGDLPGILVVTALNQQVPYRLDGTVKVGGEDINLQVPFHVESSFPRQVLLDAAGAAVQRVPMPTLQWPTVAPADAGR